MGTAYLRLVPRISRIWLTVKPWPPESRSASVARMCRSASACRKYSGEIATRAPSAAAKAINCGTAAWLRVACRLTSSTVGGCDPADRYVLDDLRQQLAFVLRKLRPTTGQRDVLTRKQQPSFLVHGGQDGFDQAVRAQVVELARQPRLVEGGPQWFAVVLVRERRLDPFVNRFQDQPMDAQRAIGREGDLYHFAGRLQGPRRRVHVDDSGRSRQVAGLPISQAGKIHRRAGALERIGRGQPLQLRERPVRAALERPAWGSSTWPPPIVTTGDSLRSTSGCPRKRRPALQAAVEPTRRRRVPTARLPAARRWPSIRRCRRGNARERGSSADVRADRSKFDLRH